MPGMYDEYLRRAFDQGGPPGAQDEEAASRKRKRWENRQVQKILKHFDISFIPRAFGAEYYSFAALKQAFPTFPVHLAFRKIPYVHKTTDDDLTLRPTRSKLYLAYQEEEAEAGLDGSTHFGLVFEWLKRYPSGAIFHNHFLGFGDGHEEKTYRFPKSDPPQALTLQDFMNFLESLRWCPGQ